MSIEKARAASHRNTLARRARFVRLWNASSTVAEAAELAGISPAAARTRAYRARVAGCDLRRHTPSRRNLVEDALRASERSRTVLGLVKQTGLAEKTVRVHLRAMVREGSAVKAGVSRWKKAGE